MHLQYHLNDAHFHEHAYLEKLMDDSKIAPSQWDTA